MEGSIFTTRDIRVSVLTGYMDDQSVPRKHQHVFFYKVTINNFSKLTVKLIKRSWIIFDSANAKRSVEGVGVVGRQPVIHPDDSFQYVSSIELESEIGHMYGQYLFKDIHSGNTFDVWIPGFDLIAPFKSN